MRGIVVCFPGARYTCEKPLLAGCAAKYESLGYSVLKTNYGSLDEFKTAEQALDAIKPLILKQVLDISFMDHDDVVFISKSFGTLVAVWLAEYLDIDARHLFLTPLEEVLPFITVQTTIAAVIGTDDKVLDYNVLRSHCQTNGVKCLVVPGADHRLEFENNPEENTRILASVLDLLTERKQ